MPINPLKSVAALVVLGLAVPSLAADTPKKGGDSKEQKVAISDLPEKVRKSADEAVRKLGWEVEWKQATSESKDGRKVFDIDGKDSEGREVEIEVREDGTVEELEREVPESEVPADVLNQLKSHMPNFQCDEIEASYKDGKLIGYNFEGKRAGAAFEVFIDPAGKLRTVEGESGSEGSGKPDGK